jgi:glycosyltransferase involved in cell wall biosynthesis
MLKRIHSFEKDLEVFDPDGAESLRLIRSYPAYKLASRVLWGIWRRLPGTSMARTLPVTLTTAVADRLAARWIPACTIYHGWIGLSFAAMQVARQRGAVTLLENAAMHPVDWQRAVLTECEALGVRPQDCFSILPPLLIRRMMREFEITDYIVLASEVARRSFEAQGYGRKAIVVHSGVDHRFFAPPALPPVRQPFRVCYVGRVEIAKGIPYLLQAWKRLALPNAELLLIGEITPEMNGIFKRFALDTVRCTGILSRAQVAEWLQRSHLMAFPSVNEGLARVILESMATGLPVVATDLSGAKDCITSGVDGTVVPARDVHALAEAILSHYNDPEKAAAMGRAARTKVEQNFTVEHYVERMIGVYCRAAGSNAIEGQDTIPATHIAGAMDASRAGSAPAPIS